MKILAIDFETTGLDLQKCQIIDVGAVLWETDRAMPLQIYSKFAECVGDIPGEITTLTGITKEDTEKYGVNLSVIEKALNKMAKDANYIAAHNGHAFDFALLDRIISTYSQLSVLPRIDTLMDLPFTKPPQSVALRSLLLDHEIINYFPHRAVTDALCMCKLLSKYDINKVVERAKVEPVRVVAQIGFEEREKARAAGFWFDGNRKHWFKNIKKSDYAPDRYAFKTVLREFVR
jgi:DNA polymerase III subunit epsilon